ncbi:hypothetical protein BJ684DRAFT_9290 [Piptocephalis cylindrospora]|uniref:PCI domain-containing protein n=1 Tax=Piptocephalis cylindrospora TaxID=1907219 RepID=A0A4P9Y505_9FUNG|nr:hypothetical protein BJ684DRAFT_9290 [Piptocephalis cylindrospora]|eukprot:RKP13983.1 hypothetical protein BJ684DRAFT_9290 [Piptocephalis cylindrospora]
MSPLDIDSSVRSFLQGQQGQEANPALKAYYPRFEEHYERKLWHQLTLDLLSFVQEQGVGPRLIPLYQHFITHFQTRLDPLKWIELAVYTSRQYSELKEASTFLDGVAKELLEKKTVPAHIQARMEALHYRLLLGDLTESWEVITECGMALDLLASKTAPQTSVHASYYRVAAEYHKQKGDFGDYYKNALLYLGCVRVDALNEEERVGRAKDLAIAALVGDTIYNFGDLLAHPILQAIQGPSSPGAQYSWLAQALVAFNRGDIGAWDQLETQIPGEPILQEHSAFLRQKIRLEALIETVFRRTGGSGGGKGSRRLAFGEVAKEAQLGQEEEVEHLVMKALSLNLIRGSIDEVDRVIEVNWVQPRFLDLDQINGMHQRLRAWGDDVEACEDYVQSQGPELFGV